MKPRRRRPRHAITYTPDDCPAGRSDYQKREYVEGPVWAAINRAVAICYRAAKTGTALTVSTHPGDRQEATVVYDRTAETVEISYPEPQPW